jgi:hypothetical protein
LIQFLKPIQEKHRGSSFQILTYQRPDVSTFHNYGGVWDPVNK